MHTGEKASLSRRIFPFHCEGRAAVSWHLQQAIGENLQSLPYNGREECKGADWQREQGRGSLDEKLRVNKGDAFSPVVRQFYSTNPRTKESYARAW
jgi:hypothetical protein